MPDQYDISALLRPRCKVCSSSVREGIDLRLLGKETDEDGERYTFEQIIDWAAAHGTVISKAGLSRHRTDHLMPDVLGAIEAQRQVDAIAQATGQTLGMEQAALNILLNKWMRALSNQEEFDLSAKGALNAGIRAVEALLKVKKAELSFSREQLDKAKDTMRGKGVSEDTLRMLDEVLGAR
ncbi:hypothetical protein [uncultured Deinococcus sp.]|uniref:hypothetical protein n=1 Tax=uncultured Deinococcus sp. TaxID=158789 RepID=UPI0025DAA521|nr:hypothetical protein [uncultured Deinococcus sp.]